MDDMWYRPVDLSRHAMHTASMELRAQINDVPDCSRANHQPAGMTGALMFNRPCFGPVPDDPHAAIQDIFERIQCDERHDDVTVLSFEPRAKRGFKSWSLAIISDESATDTGVVHIGRDSAFDPNAIDGDTIQRTPLINRAGAERHRGQRAGADTIPARPSQADCPLRSRRCDLFDARPGLCTSCMDICMTCLDDRQPSDTLITGRLAPFDLALTTVDRFSWPAP